MIIFDKEKLLKAIKHALIKIPALLLSMIATFGLFFLVYWIINMAVPALTLQISPAQHIHIPEWKTIIIHAGEIFLLIPAFLLMTFILITINIYIYLITTKDGE